MEMRGEICPEEVRVGVGSQTWELACHLALYNRRIAVVTKVICLGGGMQVENTEGGGFQNAT